MKALTLFCALLHTITGQKEDRVFYPIKQGQDVGLVIIPGASVQPEQYFAIARNIQEASEFALWVYLEDDPTSTDPPRDDFVMKSREALQLAGLPGDAPFISIGHSYGAALMMNELNETPGLVDGLITWGSDDSVNPESVGRLNVPRMTLGGDLDGIAKITDMAKQFRDLSVLSPDLRLQNPVRTLQGLNHMSYATGDILLPRDLPAEIIDEEARGIIADDSAFFIDFCARLKLGEDTTGQFQKLGVWLDYQEDIYAPLISAMEMELSRDGQEAPWVKVAQRIVGASFEPEVVVNNYVMDRDGLVSSRPAVLRINDNTVLANTTTSIPAEANWSSGQMLEAKLSSRAMFDEVLGRDPSQDPEPQCRDANQEAWNQIYPTISDLARSRYEARGYTANFKDDNQQFWGPGWVLSQMEFASDGKILNITSSVLKTSVELGGANYCKLVSPFRLIEFLYVDSLRPNGF